MTNEPTYWDKPSYRIMAGQLEDLLGKEKQLEAIADAPKCKHELIDRHTGPVLNANLTQKRHPNGEFVSMWCEGAPELRALLDALTEESNES